MQIHQFLSRVLRRTVFLFSIAYLLVAVLTDLCLSQVTPGIPPFSTISGGSYDSVNVANRNISINIPVRNKAGAEPFSFSLASNSYMSKGNNVWLPQYGMSGSTVLSGQKLWYQVLTNTCNSGQGQTTILESWTFIDQQGTPHSFWMSGGGSLAIDTQGCRGGKTNTGTTNDGSGYTAVVSYNTGSCNTFCETVWDKAGNAIVFNAANAVPSTSSQVLPTTFIDPNGNQISSTAGSTSGSYTDTLNQTALSYQFSGSIAQLGPKAWSTETDLNDGGGSWNLGNPAIAHLLGDYSDTLAATNLGFNVPANATITGISVSITRKTNAGIQSAIADYSVRLVKAGTPVGSNYASNQTWSTSYTQEGYGGDLWGTTWTASDINNSGFGVGIQAQEVLGVKAAGAYVSSMTVTVSYAVPPTVQPDVYSYTDAKGINQSYTVDYSYVTLQTNFACSGISDYGPTGAFLPTSITLPDTSAFFFVYESTPGHSGNYTGRIQQVTLPTGGTIAYAYSGGNNGINCTDQTVPILTRTLTNTDRAVSVWTYDAQTVPGSVVVTDPSLNDTVYNFSNSFQTQRLSYTNSRLTGPLLETVVTCYNHNVTNCATASVSAPISEMDVYTTLAGKSTSSLTQLTYDGYQNPTEARAYDFGGTTPVSDRVLAYGSYSNGTCAAVGNNIQNRVCTDTTKNGSGTVLAQTTYSYDAKGNATSISSLVSGSTFLTRSFTYNANGTVKTATDVNNASTGYTYGACNGLLPTAVGFALNLSESMTWDCNGAAMTSLTDFNGGVTTYNFVNSNNASDPFWRIMSVVDQAGNTTSFSYTPTTVEDSLPFNSGASIVDAVRTSDGFGRLHLAQQKQDPSATNYDTVETDYDLSGRVARVTPTYSASLGGTNSTIASTTWLYDGLNRVTSVTDPGQGQASYTYSGNDVLSTVAGGPGENAKKRQLEYDGFRRLISVCELTSGTTAWPGGNCAQTVPQTGYWATYTYSPLGMLTQVAQNAQGAAQTRGYTYDSLGRMTSETNPEYAGTAVNYVYDTDGTCGTSTGDLVKRTDAMGNVTCRAYDALHRVVNATYPSGPYAASTPKKYFVYDTATVNGATMSHAKSRLAEAYTCTGSCSSKITDLAFDYSLRGETSDAYESTPHSSGYYHLTASYWPHGALDTVSGVPGVPTLYYGASDGTGLDGEGRFTKVNAGSGQNPVTGVTYTTSGTTQPVGSLTQVVLGSSDYDNFIYDLTGRMTQYQFNVGSPVTADTGTLTWNTNGTLQQLTINDALNSANNQTCIYGYDDLVRIASANCGTTWSQTFTFDPFGNITKSGTSSFQPTYNAATNRFLTIPGGTPTYDANGNLTYDLSHSYTWDAEGKDLSIDTVNLTYDALGRMVEQKRSSTYTEIVYSPTGGKLALMSGQSLQKAFVPLPAGDTAVYNSTGLAYYRHSDWLGSSRLASKPNRTKYYDTAYGPYGENYAGSGTSDLSFTGQNQDTVSGLYDFLFREYHPVEGRWISPDPAGLAAVDATSPQTWNRYGYVGNNPLAFVDPLGLQGVKVAAPVPEGYPGGWGAWLWEVALSGAFIVGPDAVFVDGGCFGCDSGLSLVLFFTWGIDGGDTNAANNGPTSPLVMKNPCGVQGRALPPGAYVTQGQQANASTTNFLLDVSMGWPKGDYLDPQPLASGNVFQNQAYGNYVFGVYMAAAGSSLNTALSGASALALGSGAYFTYTKNGYQMDPNYPLLPAANVGNITNGYNAQKNGTVCHN